jgi:hypothetical protein
MYSFSIIFGVIGVFAIWILLSLMFIKIGWILFMVPVFHLPDLTWIQALGFALLASAFRSSNSSKKN